jgi:ribosomal protein L30E
LAPWRMRSIASNKLKDKKKKLVIISGAARNRTQSQIRVATKLLAFKLLPIV